MGSWNKPAGGPQTETVLLGVDERVGDNTTSWMGGPFTIPYSSSSWSLTIVGMTASQYGDASFVHIDDTGDGSTLASLSTSDGGRSYSENSVGTGFSEGQEIQLRVSGDNGWCEAYWVEARFYRE